MNRTSKAVLFGVRRSEHLRELFNISGNLAKSLDQTEAALRLFEFCGNEAERADNIRRDLLFLRPEAKTVSEMEKAIESEFGCSLSVIEASQFVCARAFTAELYMFRKEILHLKKLENCDQIATKALELLDERLPALREVRDAQQHHDERARGEAKGKPFPEPGPILPSSLHGNTFQIMNDVGKIVTLSISRETLTYADDTFDALMVDIKSKFGGAK